MPQPNDFRTFEKQILRGLIESDRLDDLLKQLRDITSADAHNDLHNLVILNAARLNALKNRQIKGLLSNIEGVLERNNIRDALYNIVAALPDTINISNDPTIKPTTFMTEQLFKFVFLILVLAAKLLVVLYTLTVGAGGLMNRDFAPIVLTQFPVLAVFITLFFADFNQRKNDVYPSGNDRKPVNTTLKMVVFIALPLFIIFTISLINHYSNNTDENEFANLFKWLLLVECAFGVYVGQIVYGLFREK